MACIHRLEETVINRIAAGEVIQRPANALKEMIENSIDAKSTNIQITVKGGGLKLLQIQDNGTGIRKEDFTIVCERFTTSKLREFEDLSSIATYGFRGEALASISHVAHLTIQSKTADQKCAYRASYVDSKLKETLKPIAGNVGTQIIVEDLFYNMSVRKSALRNPAEEYQKISDVVGKYAIHNCSIGFALKKYGESNDIRTAENSTHKDNIQTIYGNSISRELIEFNLENVLYKFKIHGLLTNVNYSTKKMQCLLFINHRLVDCQSLRKSIDHIYTTYLPKNMHPFVYLSLEIEPKNIDVNVHPTKHEVHFLNEDQIVEIISAEIERTLLGSNNSRVFYTQAKLPVVIMETITNTDKDTTLANKSIYDKDFVRTNANNQKIEKFFGIPLKKQTGGHLNLDSTNLEETAMDLDAENTDVWLREKEKLSLLEERVGNKESNEKSVEILDESVQILEESIEILESSVEIGDKALKDVEMRDKRLKEVEMGERGLKDVEMGDKSLKDVEMENKTLKDIKNRETVEADSTVRRNTIDMESVFSTTSRKSKKVRVESNLTTVHELRADIETTCDWRSRDLFAKHVYVGSFAHQSTSPTATIHTLLQHDTRLYLCDTSALLAELFYACILYNFENLDVYVLSDGLEVRALTEMALGLPEAGWTEADGDRAELAGKVTEILVERGAMMKDYFSMEVDKSGVLRSLPVLIDNYVPDMSRLPMFILRLATEVDWEEEKNCFRTFARETALFYSHVTLEGDEGERDDKWKWNMEHVVFAAVKQFFMPSKKFCKSGAVLQIADLPNLYKVFERC